MNARYAKVLPIDRLNNKLADNGITSEVYYVEGMTRLVCGASDSARKIGRNFRSVESSENNGRLTFIG